MAIVHRMAISPTDLQDLVEEFGRRGLLSTNLVFKFDVIGGRLIAYEVKNLDTVGTIIATYIPDGTGWVTQ